MSQIGPRDLSSLAELLTDDNDNNNDNDVDRQFMTAWALQHSANEPKTHSPLLKLKCGDV